MSIRTRLFHYVFEEHWTLGLIDEPLTNIINGEPYEIHYINGMPRDRWFADPFILDYDSIVVRVLVEEYCYKIRRGRIALITIDRSSYRFVDSKTLLDLPTHLSFPFIQRKDGNIYVYPENSSLGKWVQYRYDQHSNSLVEVKTLINRPLVDAVLVNLFGDDLVFSTQTPRQNGDTLFIFNTDGKYLQEIRFSSNIARNAGGVFQLDDKYYRPAQDCNYRYGSAVIIQEISHNTDGTIFFKDVLRVRSSNPKFTTGCHTFNTYKGLSIVDVHGYRRPGIAKLIKIFK